VLTGDTGHDLVVAHTAARKLSDVRLQRDTPVTFVALGPAMSSVEAYERIEYGVEAVPIAVETVGELPESRSCLHPTAAFPAVPNAGTERVRFFTATLATGTENRPDHVRVATAK